MRALPRLERKARVPSLVIHVPHMIRERHRPSLPSPPLSVRHSPRAHGDPAGCARCYWVRDWSVGHRGLAAARGSPPHAPWLLNLETQFIWRLLKLTIFFLSKADTGGYYLSCFGRIPRMHVSVVYDKMQCTNTNFIEMHNHKRMDYLNYSFAYLEEKLKKLNAVNFFFNPCLKSQVFFFLQNLKGNSRHLKALPHLFANNERETV